ncbi:MAG: LuxR C-terminal-related transcriptional regulator [Chitinophagales bacterium]
MPNKLNSKKIDDTLERLNALQYPPVEGSAEFSELLQCYQDARKRGYKKGIALAAGTICRMYIAHRHFAKLEPYLKELRILCEENGTWHDLYFDCLLMGIETDCTFGRFDEAIATANTFLSGLIQQQRGFRVVNAYIVIGNLYQMRGWHIRAMRVFHQAMARRNEYDNHPMFLGLWVNYAFSLFSVKQFNSALQEFKAILAYQELPASPLFLAHCHLMMSQLYAVGFADYNKCMEHTNLSLQISRAHSIHAEEAFMLVAHGLNLTKLKRYKEALPVLENKKALQAITDNPAEYIEVLNAQAECLLHLGKLKEAWKKLKEVAQMPDQTDLLNNRIRYHENCALYHQLNGNLAAMNASQEARNQAQEQLSRIEFSMQLEQVNAMMELDKKKYELEMQELKHSQMQQELRHAEQEKEMLKTAIEQRNTLIAEFQTAIKKIEKSDMKRAEIFQALNHKIASVKNSNTELNAFDLRFNEKFRQHKMLLSKKYPQLSAGEMKIASMLASGLSNKEIATITLTTTRNVENHRLQLRKKMKLKPAEDLVKKLNTLLE